MLDSEKPGPHIKGDVIPLLSEKYDLIIAHPPCTYLCNSGVCWIYKDKSRWRKMLEAADFFSKFLHADCEKIAIENPIMHGFAVRRIGRNFDFSVQPYEHGHGETKRTCFWTKGLPNLIPTNRVPGRKPKVNYESPGPDRWKNRSRTYPGIAKAMADQWGNNY